jgi:hypothetical protein
MPCPFYKAGTPSCLSAGVDARITAGQENGATFLAIAIAAIDAERRRCRRKSLFDGDLLRIFSAGY